MPSRLDTLRSRPLAMRKECPSSDFHEEQLSFLLSSTLLPSPLNEAVSCVSILVSRLFVRADGASLERCGGNIAEGNTIKGRVPSRNAMSYITGSIDT